MSETGYMADLRKKIGHDLLLVPGVAAIIRNERGQILVQRNTEGKWNLPAGALDPGETVTQALVREVQEETGLIVRPVRLVGVVGAGEAHRITYENGDVIESTTTVLECEVVAGELKPQDDETARLEYFDPADMPELPVPIPQKFFTDTNLTAFFEWDDKWLPDDE
jgi:8-oxo-dGTP pyrophosphatase MutT (NUDIX family)